MARLNLKTTAEASRKDGYTMNPIDINVYWELNERTGETYDDEQFLQLQALIEKDMVIHHPIFIRPDEKVPGKWRLEHGYRRMKAAMNLREKGLLIEAIPVKQIYSEEEAMLLHITLNNSTKAMTDLQLAGVVRKYAKLTQNDSPKFLSERTGLPYQKVRVLLAFDEIASTVMKEAVKNDEISFTAAANIALNSTGVSEQNERLSNAKEKAKTAGKKRVTGSIAHEAQGKGKRLSADLSRLRFLLCMNGNYNEVVRVIDNMDQQNSDLLTILKTEIDTLTEQN